MHRIVRHVLTGTAVTALAVLSLAAPSQATPSQAAGPSYCDFTDTVCLFDQTGYAGARFTVSALPANGTCVSLVDHGWGNRVRSAWNTNGTSAALFANDDCVGGPFQVPANAGVSDLGSFRPQSIWVP